MLPILLSFSSQASAASGLSIPTLALATGQDTVPGSNVIYAATDGSDATGDGSLGDPYATLEGAHGDASLGAGWTIVLRGGTYARSSTFTPTKSGSSGSPITVMAYPGETVILDYGNEFAGFRTPGQGLWEIEDAGTNLWRSVSTSFGGAARVYGHWEELYKWWFLYGYRDTGASISGTGASYFGPGTKINADGRVHIRFARPTSAMVSSAWPSYQPGTSGGAWVIPDSEDPNDYPIYITRKNNLKAFSFTGGVSDWHFKDINVQGADTIVNLPGVSTRIWFERGLWRGPVHGILRNNCTANDFRLLGIQSAMGRLDMWPWGFAKGRESAGGDIDDYAFDIRQSGGGGGTGYTVEDCTIANYFDFIQGTSPTAGTVVRYNWLDNIQDDMFQVGTNSGDVEFGYNVMLDSPINDWNLSNSSSSGDFYIHNNVCWLHLVRIWDTNRTTLASHAAGVKHFASGASGRTQPRKVYNNTIIVNGGSNHSAAIPLGHCDGESVNNTASANETYNNILMVYADNAAWQTGETNKEGGLKDGIAHGVGLDGTSSEELDHNHYARVLAYATAHSALIGPYYNHPTRVGGPYTFASAAALASSGANLIDAEANGTSEDHTNTGVSGMNAAAPLVDLEGLDFRPKSGSAPATGAKDLSATGWPGASNAAWRGALDPSGDGNEIGPRV